MVDIANKGMDYELDPKFNGRHSLWLVFGMVVIGISLRFLFLDADPYYYEWAGYITDEGRWVENARSLALFGELFGQNPTLHFHLAPLFQLTNYIIFELGGVSILTSRIFTALCGSAIIILFWGFFRRTATRQAILLGLALLSFQTDLVVLSRVAVPEMVIMFFQVLIYFMVTAGSSSPRRLLAAGFLLFLAMGMKLTLAPFLAIFSVIILFMPRQRSKRKPGIQAWRDLLTFWTGFAVSLIVAVLFWSIFIGISKSSLFGTFTVIKMFIKMSSAYGALGFPFEHTLSTTFNIWALGLWLSVLVWMTVGRDGIDFESRRYLVSSAIWFALYLSLMLLLQYFPTRYKVHILIPMAVNITIGISLLQRVTVRKVIDSFAKVKGPMGILRATIISFPTAAFISPLLASTAVLGAADPGRLRIKMISLVISLAATTYAAHRFKNSNRSIAFFIAFPLIAATLWLILKASGANSYPFYPGADTQFHAVWWSSFMLGVSGVSIFLVKAEVGWGRIGAARCVVAFAIAYMAISLVRIAPGYIDPHYSIKDASFNNNSLRYRPLSYRHSRDRFRTSEVEEILVVAFAKRQRLEDLLEREYKLVNSYDIYVSPEYYALHPATVLTFPRGSIVRVFKRK
jgi:4-amino-4-deoxy-L-arabinose transferase-like glycosyltransferase